MCIDSGNILYIITYFKSVFIISHIYTSFSYVKRGKCVLWDAKIGWIRKCGSFLFRGGEGEGWMELGGFPGFFFGNFRGLIT